MIAAAMVVTGCSRGSSDDSAAQINTFDTPVTIDNCGHVETFDAAPQRIISMDHCSTETLIHMGVADRIIGMGFADNAGPDSDSHQERESNPALSDGDPLGRNRSRSRTGPGGRSAQSCTARLSRINAGRMRTAAHL